jgi:hypothetical protein
MLLIKYQGLYSMTENDIKRTNKQIIHIINTWNAITIKEREPKVRANWEIRTRS